MSHSAMSGNVLGTRRRKSPMRRIRAPRQIRSNRARCCPVPGPATCKLEPAYLPHGGCRKPGRGTEALALSQGSMKRILPGFAPVQAAVFLGESRRSDIAPNDKGLPGRLRVARQEVLTVKGALENDGAAELHDPRFVKPVVQEVKKPRTSLRGRTRSPSWK